MENNSNQGNNDQKPPQTIWYHDSNILKTFIAGAGARCFSSSVLSPLDCIKTRMQFQRKNPSEFIKFHYKNGYDALKTIIKEEGVLSLYKGLPVRLLYVAPAAAVSFTIYEEAKRAFQGKELSILVFVNKKGVTGKSFIENVKERDFRSLMTVGLALGLGVVGRILGTTLRTPFDLLKQQLQIENQIKENKKRGMVNAVRYVWSKIGFKGFFEGIGITLMRDAPFALIYFSSYELFKKKFDISYFHGVKTFQHLTAGAWAGFIATCCTIPIDVVKTRLQTQSRVGTSEYDGIFHAFRKIYKEEGWRSFTRGLGPRLVYIVPSAAFSFAAFEYFKHVLGVKDK